MKRVFYLTLSLLALCLLGSTRANAEYYVGNRLTPSGIQEGDRVIFEAASTKKNYGYYLKEASGKYAWTQGLDASAIWVACKYTAGSFKYGEDNCWAWKNLSTGNYMGGTNSNPITVSDAAQQVGVKMYGKNSPWGWQDYSNQTKYPRGWDDSSLNMRGFSAVNDGDWWYANDVGNQGTGTLPNDGGLHNWAWNAFKVSENASEGVAFNVYTGESSTQSDVVINGLHYDLNGTRSPSGLFNSSATLTTGNQNLTLTSVYIPAAVNYGDVTYKVTSIANEAFQNGTFTKLEFESPANFTTIGNRTFYNCNNVTKVELPEGLTKLTAWRAFSTMASLAEIKLPQSLTRIEDHSFSTNPNLTTVFFKSSTPPTIGTWDVFGDGTVAGNITFVVPTDAVIDTYKTALDSYGYKEVISLETYNKVLNTLNTAISIGVGKVHGIKDATSLAAAQALVAGTPTFAELQDAVTNYVISFTDGYYRIVYPYYYGGADADNYLRFGNDCKLYADIAEGNLTDYSTVFRADIIGSETRAAGQGYKMTLTSQGLRPTDTGYDTHQMMAAPESQFAIAIRHNESLAEYLIGISNAAGSYVDTRYIYKKPENEYWKIYSTGGNAKSARCYIVPATDITVALHAGGSYYWATLYVPFGVTLPTGTEAFIGTVSGNVFTLNSIGQNVPAGTPVVLRGNAASITATINDAIPAITDANDLQGQYLAHTTAAQTDKLSLGMSNGVVGFYIYDGTIGANKAYLPNNASNPSNGFKFVFDDDATALNSVETSNLKSQTSNIFDLQGRKVAKPVKGSIYIKGGKVVKY